MATVQKISEYQQALKAFYETEVGKLFRAYRGAMSAGAAIDEQLGHGMSLSDTTLAHQAQRERQTLDAFLNAIGANLPIFTEAK